MYAVKSQQKKICFPIKAQNHRLLLNPAEIELLACIALISPYQARQEMPVNKHNTGYLFLKYWRGKK